MRLGVYSILDSATGIYSHPFYQVTNGAAIRAFIDACVDRESPFCKHPEDYSLAVLGQFDDQTGSFDISAPVTLMTAVNALVKD